MSKTDTDASSAAPAATVDRRSSLRQAERLPDEDERLGGDGAAGEGLPAVEPADGGPEADSTESVLLSQTVKRMGRRRTRLLAVVSLLLAIGATAMIVGAFMAPEPATPVEQATRGAWSAVTALSDGLRDLGPDGSLEPLRGEARAARKEVQAAGVRMKALQVPISQTPLRSRVIRTLRADDAWISAVGSTLANPRTRRRGDLAGLAKRAAETTALIGGDVAGAAGSVGGTGRLLSATRRGG